MRQAITIARPHGQETFEVLTGPEVPITQHHAEIKEARANPTHPEYAEIQVWESGKGRVRRQRFDEPAAASPESE